MKRSSLVLYVLLSVMAQLQGYGQSITSGTGRTTGPVPDSLLAEQINISLVKLIANPEKYHGKYVKVIGFFSYAYEESVLYLHQEDYEYGLTTNGLWVDLSGDFPNRKKLSEYNKQYVILQGIFQMNKQGYPGLYSGVITKMNRFDKWNIKR